MLDHDALVLAAQTLQPLSKTALRLTQLFADEEWDVDDVIQAVSFDAPLTGRVLRAANSAGYAGGSQVGTVEQAVARLGSRVVVRLAVGLAVRSAMNVAIPLLKVREADLWQHSVATAVVTEVIPLVTRRSIPPEAFTASLLHDVGRVIMYQQLDERAITLTEAARGAGESAVSAERTIIGADHGEIGALIAQWWGLPESMVDSIRLHEEPAVAIDARTREICDLIKVSDAGARRISPVGGEGPPDMGDLGDSLARLGLDEAKLDEVCLLATERFSEVSSQFE